jgi:hypothetical protein
VLFGVLECPETEWTAIPYIYVMGTAPRYRKDVAGKSTDFSLRGFDCLQKDKTVLKCCSGTVLPSLHISSRFEIFSNSKTKVDYGGCVTP